MYPVKNPARHTRPRVFSVTAWAITKLVAVCLVTATVPFALYIRVDSKAAKAAVTVQAAGRGKPYFNFTDGRQMRVDFRGEQNLTEALQAGQAQPRSLASTFLANSAVPDLISGYAYGGMGIVTVQHGNPDAFAPKDESVYARMQQGYNPDSLLPAADTYLVPESPDFLQVGDFNHDNRKDVLIAGRGGNLFLLAGDGLGRLNSAEQISLPGRVTALTAGEFRAFDGWTDVAIGVETPSGAALLIYDGATGLPGEPITFQLRSPATAVQISGMDNDSFMDVVVSAGNELDIIHGWGRKQEVDPQSRLERITLNNNARDLAVGFFIWNRAGSNQIAVLSDDGIVNILDQAGSDSRAFMPEEIAQFRRSRANVNKQTVDIESLAGWEPNQVANWITAREFSAGSSLATAAFSQSVLQRSHVSFHETDDLLMLNGSQNKLDIVRQIDNQTATQALSSTGDLSTTSLDVTEAPVAVLALPQKLNGERSLLVMQNGSSAPTVVPLAPTATPTVDRFDDPVGGSLAAASVCGVGAGDCSLRGAIQVANANPGSSITIPAGTYTLTSNGTGTGGCDGNTVGDLGINQATTITGAGAATTIIRQHGTGPASNGDRVMCMNEGFLLNLVYSFSGIAVVGGRDSGGFGGGGIIGGEKGNSLTLSGVTISNNQVTGGNIGGGGIQITGGDLTITNCLIGGANAPGVATDRDTVANANTNATSTAGGLYFTPSAPMHTASTGNLVVTGTTINHNTAFGTGGGGAGLEILAFASPGGIGSGTAKFDTSTFTNNQASSGGGLQVPSLPTTIGSIAGTVSFTSNSATGTSPLFLGQGGAIMVGGSTLLLDGSLATINIASSNTATNGGSSIGTNGAVTVAGTNTTIGGDASVFTNGTWTNNAGSAISPTNFSILGGVLNCNNSTMNVSGNFVMAPEADHGAILNAGSGTINVQGNLNVNLNNGGAGAVGQFNAGTGTFNFNGGGAQSITNVSAITFNNLTDSNVVQPLVVNNGFGVGGTLNINGANAIVAPVAAAVISGTGTLTGTGTARVTRTSGANNFFSQYSITNKTLTNLTVEYIGAAAQSASATTYGKLKINNSSGVTLAGNTTVDSTLTLTAGALAVATNTLVINDGTSVGAGSLTSGPTGTVNYNQSSAGQSVLAANYGNLTFSAFTKLLPSIGVIGVATAFNPNGVTTGHTITGSTFDFNGVGAQTVPAFNFNNLTISGARTTFSVTLVNGGTIGIAGVFAPTATFAGGNYITTNNTIDFNGTVAQTIPAFNYNNLTISGNRAVAITLGNGNVGVAGTFNPSVTGNTWTANASNTVVFNGSAAQTIPAFAFFNGLTLSNAAGANLGGNVTVLNGLSLNAGALGVGTNTLTLNGAASFGAGTLTSSPTGTVIYNQQSNGQATVLAANYGNLTFSNFSKTLASTGTIGIAGTFTPGTGTGHTITGSTINFNAAGPQTIPGFTYNNLTSTGAVARTLDPVNTIKIAGVFTPGASSYTITGSTIEYNGSAAQTLAGAFLQYNNVTFNNPTTVTGGPATLDVNGNLQITQGTFAAGGSLSITVGGNWTNNGGAFSPSTGDVTFDGGAGQAIGGTAATTFNNLSVGNASGLAMNNDNTVNGVLALVGSDVTVAATKTLTQPNTGNSSGAFDVNGRLQRTGIDTAALNTTFTFGNPNNQITVTAGTRPTNIVVDLTRTVPVGAQGFPTAVQRYYTITPATNAFTGTLRLRYLDPAELNGNVEGANFIFRRFNGTGWQPVFPTTTDFVNNWLEKTGVTQFSPWTFNSTFAPTASNGVITGRIVDNNGAPVEGAVVRLEGTQNRKFITDANGVYRFENVETNGFYTVTPSRVNYTFSPAARSFSQAGESTEATFGATALTNNFVNPLDTPEYFVRQHYLDFLGREPDEAGFNFWSDEIIGCGADQDCIGRKRENVSAAYFLSIEFQSTGGLVDGLYRAGYEARPQFSQFMTDTREVGLGVVVGRDGWQAKLQANKEAFATAFVNRPAFRAAYDGLSSSDYVDALISHAGVSFTVGDRDALVTGLTQGTMSRAQALTAIAENERFVSAKFNDAFVMMEYFGYLRRDPDAGGFQYWLDKLNHFGGNFQQAEMVRAFMVSGEYRDRFPK